MTTPDLLRLHNLLPGVPHIESPFFAQLFSDPGLDAETVRIAHDLHHKGFAIINFPEPELEQITQQICSNLLPRYDWPQWHEYGHKIGPSLRLMNAWRFDENIRRLACNQHILDLLGRLYGAPAWPFQTLNFPVGTQQHFHSDSVHFSSNPERFMCGVWIAFEDVDEDNGPLMYIPGSHRWPIYTNEHIGLSATHTHPPPTQAYYEPMWRELIAASGIQPEYFHAKKGQALIWAANLMHGGSVQRDKDRTRWSQVTHYFFENCAYYVPMYSDVFYGNIHHRKPINILTGQGMPQHYAGHEISPAVFGTQTRHLELLKYEFDAALYLQANPDVAENGMNPYEHYLRYGFKEGRMLRNT